MPQKHKRWPFSRSASIVALKAAERERAIFRGWSVGNIASVGILWELHNFDAEMIRHLCDDIQLLKDDYNGQASDEVRKSLTYERVDAVEEALGINLTEWFEPGLSRPEMVGVSAALENIICALHDDDYFGVEDDELKAYYAELKERINGYALGKWNLQREKKRLELETGVTLDEGETV